MKKLIAIVIIFTITVSYSGLVYAMPKSIDKLKGGVMDVMTSPKELKDYTVAGVKDSKIMPLGFLGGLLKGTAQMGKKAIYGAVDIATFPIDLK